MRLFFVRHGHPDYEKDCLTELGHIQAERAAMRLKEEGIKKIYSRQVFFEYIGFSKR